MEETFLIEFLRKKGIINDKDYIEYHNAVKSNHSDMAYATITMEEGHHFTEEAALNIVSRMFHYYNGKKYIGEKFTMDRAKEVWSKYHNELSSNVLYTDIYVAINALYHDYCTLFKSWFIDNIEHKIIESAIVFWFEDEDYNGHKLWEYFNED